jgi:pantoate--beta-alanine ligase
MKIFSTIKEIKENLSLQKVSGKTIGFVPTMGALHKGHLSLIEYARKENDTTVCSIFINPIQFNNKEDYIKYPKSTESDILMLEKAGCDFLFMPEESEMYPDDKIITYELGSLDKNMEGAFRPGHFNGVAVIVKKLFDIIEPDRAYFGQKDFQQLAIIKYFVKQFKIPVQIIGCQTVRENDGLAMSSRNQRLTTEERVVAPLIYKTLIKVRSEAGSKDISTLKKMVEEEISKCSLMKLEYFDIVDAETLQIVHNIRNHKSVVGCIAVYLGNVRLIDNVNFL